MEFSPQNSKHSTGVALVLAALQRAFPTGYYIRGQFPLDLGQTTEPEPDAAVVIGAGVADYWVLNLVSRQVEVYRIPIPDPAELYGYRYSSRVDVRIGGAVSPLAAPTATLAVADLLPP